jgi:arsenate reductase
MNQLYGIDMEQTQYSKTLDKIPEPDIAISMGCDVGCPYVDKGFDDNWELKDPTGMNEEDFIDIIKQIEMKIEKLKSQII